MKNFFRATILTSATLCLAFGLSNSPAHADGNFSPVVRTAQMQMAELGYYVGRYDGVMGPVTKSALMDFQRRSGLPINGRLNPDTFTLLSRLDYEAAQAAYYPPLPDYRSAERDPYFGNPTAMEMMWDNRWQDEHTDTIPTNYGELKLHENDQAGLRQYTITLNNHPVFVAHNQMDILRVSSTYSLKNEDAVIFTAYNADGVCAYKNYLLTVHSNGTFDAPKEIGNCTNKYEAHVADNALIISFPNNNLVNGWHGDVWSYNGDKLARL